MNLPAEPTSAARREALLAWYDEHRRDLPWREPSPDPYRVWLSEVMLQQTRVETVRKRYREWLARFPTLEALAEADGDEVLKAWEGLGYYARARNLHRAVREVRDGYRGTVPDDPEAFRTLPGVGRYTAGAVMSIAFGRPEPVVDGNVRRVLARWNDDPAPSDRDLWEEAGEMVRAGGGRRPGALNQALMELGATVCTPRSPSCDACPVAATCAAFAAGTQEERPAKKRARSVPHHEIATALLLHEGSVLLRRRPEEGLLGGMWELPGVRLRESVDVRVALARGLAEEWGLEVLPGDELEPVSHAFTHLRVTYRPVCCGLAAENFQGDPDLVWCPVDEMDRFALPVAQRRMAALAGWSGR